MRGNILSEEEKYAILRELVVNCAAEQSQEGDFVEDIAKEISVVKGGTDLSGTLLFFLLPG